MPSFMMPNKQTMKSDYGYGYGQILCHRHVQIVACDLVLIEDVEKDSKTLKTCVLAIVSVTVLNIVSYIETL